MIIPSEEPRAYNHSHYCDINMESVAGEQTALEGLIKLRQRELTESAEVLTKHQAVLKERTQLRTRLHAAEELLEVERRNAAAFTSDLSATRAEMSRLETRIGSLENVIVAQAATIEERNAELAAQKAELQDFADATSMWRKEALRWVAMEQEFDRVLAHNRWQERDRAFLIDELFRKSSPQQQPGVCA
eukprot:GEMP01087979.1.p1 GENE.GEMP01087979.1~~GEMP01087979.1.p1  ORF type:complete len:208 (+),score=35.16 GEMP01087979.1:58-624(+)